MAQYITFQPSDYFNTKLYTGNGSTQNITGIGFDPDWIWCKSRALETHELYDKVRGATKRIRSDSTAAENTESYQSFITDGFSFSTGGNVNSNGVNFVSWNWKANGQGSSNTNGSINTTYTSASTISGFSIVKFTATGSAATVGHGLSTVPKMILVKRTDSSHTWQVYHEGIGATKYLELQSSQAEQTSSGRWNDTTPTSSVFSIGSEWGSGAVLVAYCFADVTGYQKIGSWTGTSNANGPMIYTGFKPAFVLSKNSDRNENWLIHDNKRGTINVNQTKLSPNDNSAESSNSAFALDFLSNGFKIRTTDTALNQSGEVYTYLAIAEHPLVSSNDIPGVAR